MILGLLFWSVARLRVCASSSLFRLSSSFCMKIHASINEVKPHRSISCRCMKWLPNVINMDHFSYHGSRADPYHLLLVVGQRTCCPILSNSFSLSSSRFACSLARRFCSSCTFPVNKKMDSCYKEEGLLLRATYFHLPLKSPLIFDFAVAFQFLAA